MASLKQKASTKKSSSGALDTKAKFKAKDDGAVAAIPPSEAPGMANINAGLQFNAPPPLPPEFAYLIKYAQIPGLRKKAGALG